jgi:hypothetical protein
MKLRQTSCDSNCRLLRIPKIQPTIPREPADVHTTIRPTIQPPIHTTIQPGNMTRGREIVGWRGLPISVLSNELYSEIEL